MTTAPTPTTTTWQDWLRRWDAQQEVYIEQRERAFDVMLSFLEVLAPPTMRVLDLAAGPGAISQRVLRRFPDARCVAIDTDPVLLQLGQGALGDQGGRLRWVRADLRDDDWTSSLGDGQFDAVLSTTATHWLTPPELTEVYARLAQLLRPGGVLLNGDGMPLGHQLPQIREALQTVTTRRQERALDDGHGEDWQSWWDALRTEASLRDAFAERDRIFPPGSRSHRSSPTLSFHQTALLEAGFAEVAPVWQDLNKRIVLALR